MKNSKSGQFLIFSGFFLVMLLIFIYYTETQNNYILNLGNDYILNNIIYESCMVGKLSNGSNIDTRNSIFISDISNYCFDLGIFCDLNIIKNSTGQAIVNLTLLNYTYYDYSINYSNFGFEYFKNYTC